MDFVFQGIWLGISEYHLQVEDVFSGFDSILTRGGSPSPGQCEYSGNLAMVYETGFMGVEDISGYDDEIFIFAHSVMWWY